MESTNIATDALSFYAESGPMTFPGRYEPLLAGLPDDIGELCRVVQGLMIHVFWAEQYGVTLSEARRGEVQLRTTQARLERVLELEDRPLSVARPPEKRTVGNCRDFSVMLAALLRHQNVPARARCGFGRYFLADHYEDHWVCEYWNATAGCWQLVDAQLDELQREKLAIPFEPLDVPRDQFIVGGKAWELCRSGEADPHSFGIFDMHGLWFVRGNLVRDVAALNKVELLPWDGWGLIEGEDEILSANDLALLDEVAALTSGDVPEWARVRSLYAGDYRLRVPETIRSYIDGSAVEVQLIGV